jgi:OmpA-OmpF porin, OOP family
MVRPAWMILALALPAGVAQANYYYGEGPYIGFGVGVTSYDIVLANWDDNSLGSGSVDDDDAGVKFFWGYKLSENFGMELFYVNLGETSFSAVSDGSGDFWESGNVSGYTKNQGYGFSAYASVPLSSRFDVYGKAGMYRWSVRERVANAVDNRPISDSGSDMLFGGGVGINLTDRSALRVEWERYINVYDVYDVDMMSLGFVHKF